MVGVIRADPAGKVFDEVGSSDAQHQRFDRRLDRPVFNAGLPDRSLPANRPGIAYACGRALCSVPLVRRAWSIVHVGKLAWTLRSLGCRGGRRVVPLETCCHGGEDGGRSRLQLGNPENVGLNVAHGLTSPLSIVPFQSLHFLVDLPELFINRAGRLPYKLQLAARRHGRIGLLDQLMSRIEHIGEMADKKLQPHRSGFGISRIKRPLVSVAYS